MAEFLNYVKVWIYGVFIMLGIKTGQMEVLFWLMMLDSLLGVCKSRRLGFKFDFKVLLWGMIFKMSILLIPLIVGLVAKGVGYDFKLFITAVLNILIVNEGISCITNIISIKTNEAVENKDYVTMLLNKIRQYFTVIVDKMLYSLEAVKSKSEE